LRELSADSQFALHSHARSDPRRIPAYALIFQDLKARPVQAFDYPVNLTPEALA
jgi:hypothetical protein